MRSKKRTFAFNPAGVEDAGGQPQQGVNVVLGEEPPSDGLPCPAFKEDVVGNDDGGAAVDLQRGGDVLDEVQLLVGGGDPEVGAAVGDVLALGAAVDADDRD